MQRSLINSKYSIQSLNKFNQIPKRFTAAKVQRPVSPHLQIYQYQLPWLMSIGHRVTGVALSTATYASAMGFAAFPGAFGSSSLIAAIYSVPLFPLLVKFGLSFPFTYHTFNGIRHLLWDYRYALALKNVYLTGYAVSGATLASTLYLCSL